MTIAEYNSFIQNSGSGLCNNTVIGFCASCCVAGSQNNIVAIGCRALNLANAGGGSVAVGAAALANNTLAIANVAVGAFSGCAITSGCCNVLIGCGTAPVASVASGNVLVGYQSGVNLSTGCNNSFLGIQSGFGMQSGCGNTFLGCCSGYFITTGCFNVILGSNPGSAIASQSCNVIVADGAGNIRLSFTNTGAVSLGPTTTCFGANGATLRSGGPGLPPYWGGGESSGFFNTAINCAVGAVVTDLTTTTFNTAFNTTTAVVATMPSTTSTRYLIHSIHITNTSAADAEISGRFDLTSGAGSTDTTLDHFSYFAGRLPVPSGASVELIKRPQVLKPNDSIKLMASGVGGAGAAGVLFAYISYESSSDTGYEFGAFNLSGTSPTNIYQSTTNPSVVESIRVTNFSGVGDYRITVSWTNSLGTVQSYVCYNLLVPAYATVELLERPKRLNINDLIRATAEAANVLSIQVSGKRIT